MATPRRRSARLRGSNPPQASSARRAIPNLGDLLERDETPDVIQQQQSIDDVVATPASSAIMQNQLSKLSALSTPKTEPRLERGEMHPKTIHQTTTKAPDSGLKLGFVDVPTVPHSSIASLQNSPCKPRSKVPTAFEFQFVSESELSAEAQKLMDSVREEAAQIKLHMQAAQTTQNREDDAAETMFEGYNASGRKIAKPKSKVGRFSDIHMAEFKKMDSIANHPSSFRTKQSTLPTQPQSLKRSGSRAGLDEPERPRTAGKGTPRPGSRPMLSRPSPGNHFRPISAGKSSASEIASASKRIRHSELQDVSAAKTAEPLDDPRPSNLPRSISSTLLSPTKSSMAKSTQIPKPSPQKTAKVPYSESLKRLNGSSFVRQPDFTTFSNTNVPEVVPATSEAETQRPERALPPIPVEIPRASSNLNLLQSKSATILGSMGKRKSFNSKLPTFSGLKSILRSARKASGTLSSIPRSATPKRLQAADLGSDSPKKVDFTPSVKSRYAVKLAAASPSPAKIIQLPREELTSSSPTMYDSAAYLVDGETDQDDWVEIEDEVLYPVLPDPEPMESTGPVIHTFTQKAKDHNRRESKEFKSIFTTLHHPSRPCPPSTVSSVNTTVNKDHATTTNNIMRSPSSGKSPKQAQSTIRHVRDSGVTDISQPFENSSVKTVPHGLPAKKRRHESIAENDKYGQDEDAKENRRVSVTPHVPGGWQDSILDEDESGKRAGKRARLSSMPDKRLSKSKTEMKKPSAAREAAAKNAKDRKGKGILSLSRLNMLSRPKQRD